MVNLDPKSDQGTVIQLGSGTFRLEQLASNITKYLQANRGNELNAFLQQQKSSPIEDPFVFSYPTVGQILKPDGEGWQGGTIEIKICFEFHPHIQPDKAIEQESEPTKSQQPASPLDAIREG
jgi:hypothetical protein